MMKTILLLTIVVSAMALDLPSNFKTCKRSDPKILDCITVAVKDAVISMAQGLKDFKILPLEPLAIDSIKIGESEGSMSLKQEYKNIKIYGITKDMQLYNYRIDWDNLIFKSETFNRQVDFIADYKIDGKILVLPIQGEGKCNISMHDIRTTHEIHFETFEKNGDTYMRAKKYIIKLIPKHVILHFDNLFNGNTILDEQIHNFINQNSDLLFKELQTPYEETISLFLIKITNQIFTRVPMNKIFK